MLNPTINAKENLSHYPPIGFLPVNYKFVIVKVREFKLQNTTFWDLTPCSRVDVYRGCLHLQISVLQLVRRKSEQTSVRLEPSYRRETHRSLAIQVVVFT
jgi:hypothetical protein